MFDQCTTLQSRSHVGTQRVAYHVDRGTMPKVGPNPFQLGRRDRDKDDRDLMVMQFRERQAIANVRMRVEYGR